MRDALEWGLRAGVIGAALFSFRKWLARALIWGLRPDLYDRVNQALDWEREQNRILQSRIDRLTSDRSGDESRTGPNGTDTSE
jgi:hypothetical protein